MIANSGTFFGGNLVIALAVKNSPMKFAVNVYLRSVSESEALSESMHTHPLEVVPYQIYLVLAR